MGILTENVSGWKRLRQVYHRGRCRGTATGAVHWLVMRNTLALIVVLALAAGFPMAAARAADTQAAPLTADIVNSASAADPGTAAPVAAKTPDPGIIRLQIFLDRAGASPGVIDGFDGDNVRKAIAAYGQIAGADATASGIDTGGPVLVAYTVSDKDIAEVTGPVPTDYAEMAKMKLVGYATNAEALAEKFHMAIDLLQALNPGSAFNPGDTIAVADVGDPKKGDVAKIEVDKAQGQLRGYDASGKLLVAYPATIGSADNPSPSGTHKVDAIAPNPNYTYDPSINFQQGSNDKKLIIPPGPNGPVGSMWIDLTEPTYGIHGSPDPELIDKSNSHGCVRLSNWDAEELAGMVKKGVPVNFLN